MKDQDKFIRAARNLSYGFAPEGSKPAHEDMTEVIRSAILESDCGASVADAIIALDRIRDELMAIALGTSMAYQVIQDYSIDIHGRIEKRNEGACCSTRP